VTVDKKLSPRLVGYARVSTVEQNLDMQVEALLRAGVEKRHLHVEKISASAKCRPMFDWAVKSLRPGDTFVVWRIDRLGRDVRAIHKTLDAIKEAGATVRSLTENMDTTTPTGEFVLNLTASLAQLERDNVRLRTRAGVDAARRRGVSFGQPPKLTPAQQAKCREWRRTIKPRPTVRELVVKAVAEFKLKDGLSHGAMQNYLNPKPRKTRPTS
jgi:DNA invertase Pin-like site-specific DNA recombinase